MMFIEIPPFEPKTVGYSHPVSDHHEKKEDEEETERIYDAC